MGQNSVSRVRIAGTAAQRDPAVWCGFTLCKAILHAESGAQTPRWRFSVAVLLFQTAQIGPRQAGRGPDRPKVAQHHPKRVRSAPRSCVNGIHHFAIRPGAIGARNTASWDPCDPPGPPFVARLGPFVVLSPRVWPGARLGLQPNLEARWAQKRSKWKISKVVPDPWGGSNGPLWANMGLF